MSKEKIGYRSGSKASYNRFCAKHPSVDISYPKWREVIYTYNHLFRDYVLETGEKAPIGGAMGHFTIAKRPTKKFRMIKGVEMPAYPIDWKKTKEKGTWIFNMNAHSDGFRYKWHWFRNDARFFMAETWVFRPSRVSSRKIAEYVNKLGGLYAQSYKQWKLNAR